MFNHKSFKLASFLFLIILIASCTKDQCKRKITFKTKVPVYDSLEEIRNGVDVKKAQALKNPGKIYFRTDDYLFVGEKNKGIHIFDNADPSNPQNIGYIKIPGNTDMAIKGDMLYANSFVDLYVVDISNPSNAKIVDRKDRVFDQSTMTSEAQGKYVKGKGVIVGYKKEEVTKVVDCQGGGRPVADNNNLKSAFPTQSAGSNATLESAGVQQPIGIGGSMARFAVSGDYLYSVDWKDLHIFNVSNPGNPEKANEKKLQWGIETIFPYKDKLFIGSRTGMFIYDNSIPTDPTRLSEFNHATVCDPVYPTDSYAYVTLNGSGECGMPGDELDVLDITDIENPILVETYSMQDPQGLAVRNDVLYLCDGTAGLKVYSTKNKEAIANNQLDHVTGIHAFDAIPFDQVLMVVGNNGLYQYDYSNPDNLEQLSHISASRQ